MTDKCVIDDDIITIIESDVGRPNEAVEYYALRVYIHTNPPRLGRAIIPGIPDAHRMRRALCYFDVTLFAGNAHRERLLSQTFDATRTGRMYRAVVDAYRTFDCGADMFIFDLERVHEPVFTRPTITPFAGSAEPLQHALRHCTVCFRVEELSRTGVVEEVFVCERCNKRKKDKA